MSNDAKFKKFDFDPDTKSLEATEEIKKAISELELIDDYIEPEDLDEVISYSYRQGYNEAVNEFKEFVQSLGMIVLDD